MLMAEVMTCDVLKSKKREQKPIPPKLDSEVMRTSSPALKMLGIAPIRTIENLKARSRIRRSR